MMAVFLEFIKEIVEVFMDDFSVYGKTFADSLANLDKVLTRCGEVCRWFRPANLPRGYPR
jgi:hypothetical protein